MKEARAAWEEDVDREYQEKLRALRAVDEEIEARRAEMRGRSLKQIESERARALRRINADIRREELERTVQANNVTISSITSNSNKY